MRKKSNKKNAFTYTGGLKKIGVSYLGGVSTSHKTELSAKAGTDTYCVYLAPATMADKNHTTCPNSKFCKEFCLAGSGLNKVDELAHGKENSRINKARIKKTKSFWYDRENFMRVLVHEIRKFKKRAEKKGRPFSVRLNGTSDLSPEDFVLDGKNILEIFPNVQFYDYTKVPARFGLVEKYPNYDLTFSFNGHNKMAAKRALDLGIRVAVVFANQKKLPKRFMGVRVVNGNKYDMRYEDPQGCIIGLSYHTTANDYKMIDGKRTFVEPVTDFVIRDNDVRCAW